MFDELRDRMKSVLTKVNASMDERPLSIVPETKAADFSFDMVSAGWYAKNGYNRIYASLAGGLPAWSGEPVSLPSALGLSTVFACKKIISESLGTIPLNMMRKANGINSEAEDHPLFSRLRNAPNVEQSAQTFIETLTGHCVMQGNGYAQIVRRSGTGTAVELNLIQPDNVYPDREKTGQRRLVYVIKEANQPNKTYTVQSGKPQDILHIRGLGWDGIQGYSVIAMARQSLGTAIAQERNVANFYAAGGRVPYVLKHPQKFASDEDFDRFRADWEKTYAQPHKAPILEDGLDYEQIGLSAADAQLIESRQFTIPELCRWFGVSPHLVGDLSKATFSNVENLAEQFDRFTLSTWRNRWVQELWRCVLTPEEQTQGYYFQHDMSALLKSDFQQRIAGYAAMLTTGIESINEVRAQEGLNPVPGGDEHYVMVNMAPVGTDGKPTAPAARVKVQ
jgi:HK97 family phage portal protein